MGEYSNIIQGAFGTEPQANVTANINVDPDQTARALQLSQVTGVPPSVISGDLDNFERTSKTALANTIVSKNTYIQDYVQSHPLASSISNDDYGNLDKVSQGLNTLASPIKSVGEQLFQGFKAGVGQGKLGDWTGIDWQDPKVQAAHPYESAIASTVTGVTDPLEAVMRLTSGGITSAAYGVAEAYHQITGKKPPISPENVSQAVQDPGLWAALGPAGEALGLPFEIAGHNAEMASHIEAVNKARPWLMSGKEPPAGIHPLIDKLKLDQNQTALQLLDEKVADAQQSLTRERAPDLFRDFVAQHVGDTNIGISGQAALGLYGDRVPTADDGLLGWAPDIQTQLENAKETGADISVPMADWIAKADPKIAETLHDDLRVTKDGITNREFQDLQSQPPLPGMVDENLPIIRGVDGLEPLFSIGDRKLTLQRMLTENTGQFGPEQGFHDFDMVNQDGQKVGSLNLSEQKGGKELYIEMINGLGDYYNPNHFGPALTRSLIPQIEAEFPDAEWLTGHRVSGARDKTGAWQLPSAMPRIPLNRMRLERGDIGDGPAFKQLLNGQWDQWSKNVQVFRGPDFQGKEFDLQNAIKDELKRISPSANLEVVRGIRSEIHGGELQGAYDPQTGRMLVSMDQDNPLGTVHHEAIHDLLRRGFFSQDEWSKLEAQSRADNWIQKFGIDKTYGQFSPEIQMEESIAEGFRHWRRGQEILKDPGVFQRIADFIDRLHARIKQILGRDFNWEEVFKRVDEGQVGSRIWGPDIGKFDPLEMGQIKEEGQGIDAASPFHAAKDVGMSVPQYRNYMKLIEDRQQADLEASSRRIEKEQRKRQSAEWKANSEAMRPQVLHDLNQRPDVAADKFFGLGELFGHKLESTYKLDHDSLTPEQRAALPEKYITKRNGVKPDDVAHLFGYQAGDQLISHLAQFNKMREDSGLNRDKFHRQLVSAEIARRMESEHGILEKNILEDSRDQILSENQLDLLHEETHALAGMAGAQFGDITRDQLVSQIKSKFDQLPMGVVDSEKWLREGAKHGRNAELSLLSNKPADAFRSKQAQYYNTIYAKLARDIEKARSKLDKTAKPFRKIEVKGIEPEYLNHIQNILQGAGYKVGRSLENIQENLTRRGKTLEQFTNEKLSESFGYRNIPVADFILDGGLKSVDKLTTWEFGGLKQTVDALIKNAKDEQKIIREGEAQDRADVLKEMQGYVERFDLKPTNVTPTLWDKIKEIPKSFLAGSTNMETFLNRLGDRDPQSVFNRYITYPAAAAANRKSALQRQFSRIYRSIGEVKDKDKLVPSPLRDPLTEQPFSRFTRGNVMQMLQNAGNQSNWTVLAKGYGADPEALMHWLVANTTKEDWIRAQHLGKEVFGELVKLADQEYEHLNGITIDKIPLSSITNTHGTFEGWYHPLVKDPIREGKSAIKDGAYDDADFGHITTANGYTKKRTGAAYPLDLNPNMTPVRINQMIHDISFRNFVLETQKIFKDPGLSNDITARYGAEYNGRNFLIPWLKAIAGQESIPSRAAATANRISEWLRQNVVSTYIGFNPFTALKHGPTAFMMSSRQVGTMNFLRAVQDLYGRSPSLTRENHEFVMKWGEELQRRERHWQDTIFGAHGEIEGASGFRENMIQHGSWLVAKSDMLSAKPTWLAAYRTAQEKGLSHGDSINEADAAVRLAHGSTAITNQPGLVRGGGPIHNWLTSVYGFFGTAMQRRIELAQDINDSYKLVKQGQLNDAAAKIPSILADTFTYVVWPTLVEEAVTGLTTQNHEGWGEYLTKASLLGLSSSVLYARDIVHGLLSGQDVGVGMISSALHDIVKGAHSLAHPDAFTAARMGKTIGDTLTALGHTTGMAPKTIDNAIHFGIDLVNNQAHPKTAGDWLRGITKGTTKERQVK